MQKLRIRNWDKWQSYRRDRGQPPWIKVHRLLMRNMDWVSLTDAQRGQLVAIWLLAADHDGVIPASPEIIKKLCFMDSEPDLQVFVDHGFIEAPPDWRQRDANVTPSERQVVAPETEAETETEAEAEEAPTEPSAGADPEPPKVNGYDRELEVGILAAYHEILPNLPKVRDWNDRRKRKLRDRIRERVKDGKPADQVDYWVRVFRKASESDFLMGRKTDWRCPGLEWLLEPKNFTKLIEGAYDNHGRS